MTPTEATAAMTYANQLDGRVPVNEANADLWASALAGATVEQVRWIIRDHYTRATDSRGEAPTITPALIRRRAHTEAERAAARRAALESKPSKPQTVGSWRSQNPDEWDRLMVQGAVERLERLERSGEIGDDQWRLDAYRSSGALPPPTASPNILGS